MDRMKKNKKKQQKVETKITKFYFMNQGKSYTMLITSPIDVPVYRLKEIFNNNFVGKGSSIIFDPTIFSKYDATYIVI